MTTQEIKAKVDAFVTELAAAGCTVGFLTVYDNETMLNYTHMSRYNGASPEYSAAIGTIHQHFINGWNAAKAPHQ